jgi:predicted dehydrogenase
MEYEMDLWLIGAGNMAEEYAKILLDLKVSFLVIGRGEDSAQRFKSNLNLNVIMGGIGEFLKRNPIPPSYAIVAVNTSSLHDVVELLVTHGIKNILVEKPGGLKKEEFSHLKKIKTSNTNIYIGYNRRFYSSVRKAKEIIQMDGGILSVNFEFTEWSFIIENLNHPEEVKNKWFLANSSHLVDLVLFFIGRPDAINCLISGNLSWHPSGSIFSGVGRTTTNILFSYNANWESSGRWGIELLTNKRKLILRPLEKLFTQTIGQTEAVEVSDIDFTYDKKFKPGLYLEVKSFLNEITEDMVTLEEMIENLNLYSKISGEKY